MNFLVDTNVVSEFVRDDPDVNVIRWFEEADEDAVFLSAMTIAELRRGISILADGQRKRRLDRWLGDDLVPRFSSRIIAVDEIVADRWGRFVGNLRCQDVARHAMDAFIAATAFVHSLALATRNVRDFTSYGIKVVDPFQPLSRMRVSE